MAADLVLLARLQNFLEYLVIWLQ